MTIIELKDYLSTERNICIISHMNPDGDAIGTSLALKKILTKLGHSVEVVTPNSAPKNMRTINGFETIVDYYNSQEKAKDIVENAEMLFFVDLNDIEKRVGDLTFSIKKNEKAVIALLDHHVEDSKEGIDFYYVDSKTSSAALLLYRFLTEIGYENLIDAQIGYAIYIGMMTDTGNFSYGFLTSELYNTIAKLVEKGVNPQKVNDAIFNQSTEDRLRLWGYVMSEKMVVLKELKTAYITLTADELRRFNYKDGDTEGLVNTPLSIEGVCNTAMFTEKEGTVRISLRSTANTGEDMNVIAKELFNGGGHINASGARSQDNIEISVIKFVNAMRNISKNK